jgi:hypothetical protein
MKCRRLLLVFLAIGSVVWVPLWAQPTGRENPVEIRRSNVVVLAEEDAQDAADMAAQINEALNLRREVVITLHDGSTIVVAGRVSARRYWLVVPLQDRSEIRFRTSMIASVKLK